MKSPPFSLLLAALCLACWPVLLWFAMGTLDGSNDSAGLLAAAAAAAVLAFSPAQQACHGRYCCHAHAWPYISPPQFAGYPCRRVH